MIMLNSKETIWQFASPTGPFTSNQGIIKPLSCNIRKELNGIPDGEFTINVNDEIFSLIETGSVLQINTSQNSTIPDTGDIFRVYQITKPINFVSTVRFRHIFYDLTKVVVPVFSNKTIGETIQLLSDIAVSFDVISTIFTSSATISNEIPRTFFDFIGGRENSFLDTFQCCFFIEGNILTFTKPADMIDNGMIIEYGKNMSDFNIDINSENRYTAVQAYATYNGSTYVGNTYKKPNAWYGRFDQVYLLDMTNKYSSIAPTTASLTSDAEEYATNNDIEVPKINVSISIINNDDFNIQWSNITIAQKLKVYFPKYDFYADAQIIKTEYNPELRRLTKIEIGNYKPTLYSSIKEMIRG